MDLLAGAGLAIGTFLVLVVGLGVVGFVVLFRRRGDRVARATELPDLTRRAGTLLVRLDDAVRDAEAEVGYALAQFGPAEAAPFATALDEARGTLAEAFRLRQALDDAQPDTPREQREWTLQIIALCERAHAVLDGQDESFRRRRSLEANAAGTLDDLRRRIRDTRDRLAGSRQVTSGLLSTYAPSVVAGIADNVERADRLVAEAETVADAAAPDIHDSGVNAVSARLADAARAVLGAGSLLDGVDRRAAELMRARSALDGLRAATRADIAEARAEIDAAPDPDSAARILAAIDAVVALTPSTPANPVADLDELTGALGDLDLALAASRNEASRRSHARAAYEGTLVSARSQIAVAKELVAVGGTGVAARTRLAEAERQLMIAQAETDPVEALDAARRAVTHARDADALARYDTMGRR